MRHCFILHTWLLSEVIVPFVLHSVHLPGSESIERSSVFCGFFAAAVFHRFLSRIMAVWPRSLPFSTSACWLLSAVVFLFSPSFLYQPYLFQQPLSSVATAVFFSASVFQLFSCRFFCFQLAVSRLVFFFWPPWRRLCAWPCLMAACSVFLASSQPLFFAVRSFKKSASGLRFSIFAAAVSSSAYLLLLVCFCGFSACFFCSELTALQSYHGVLLFSRFLFFTYASTAVLHLRCSSECFALDSSSLFACVCNCHIAPESTDDQRR